MIADADRLRDDLLTNGSFGAETVPEGHGRTVLTGSEADREAREYFVERLRERGLDVRVDPVGNVAGRWRPPGADPEAAPVAAGSHLDSVPTGGIFDGPLGVYGALEAVRTLQDAGVELDRPIDVVSFTEEEGARFGVGLLGSSVVGGHRSPEQQLEREDEDGTTLATALEGIGFRGDDIVDASEWDAWLELHIEQGRELEQRDVAVGVVTAITGLTNCRVEVVGETDHAGSTRMDERSDALVAAGAFVGAVDRIAREVAATESDFAVATVGELDVEPNTRNAVPGRVRLSMDVRDTEEAVMTTMVEAARRRLARIAADHGVEATLERYRTEAPVVMSERCRSALTAAAEAAAVEAVELPSGGGHDTMNLADCCDVGLLFAPSRAGISHSPREWTDWDDCARASTVLARALATLATDDER